MIATTDGRGADSDNPIESVSVGGAWRFPVHLHILGICGTFMGGLALLARAAGHRVTGCDANVYPPMSTQLAAQGIELIEGWGADQAGLAPDVFVIGNVVTRGNPLMEAILDRGLPYVSGPQWLRDNVLAGRWVAAVAGTHGKTTTAAMLTWILEECGLAPGFLIGGVPANFGVSARLNPPCPPLSKGGWGGFGRAETPKFAGTPPMRNPGSSPACSRIHASMEAAVVLPCVPATATTHFPARTFSLSHCGPET